jgi:hypothetical protein
MRFLDGGDAVAGQAEGVAVVERDPGGGGDVDAGRGSVFAWLVADGRRRRLHIHGDRFLRLLVVALGTCREQRGGQKECPFHNLSLLARSGGEIYYRMTRVKRTKARSAGACGPRSSGSD